MIAEQKKKEHPLGEIPLSYSRHESRNTAWSRRRSKTIEDEPGGVGDSLSQLPMTGAQKLDRIALRLPLEEVRGLSTG
jgi:hypothetical protein